MKKIALIFVLIFFCVNAEAQIERSFNWVFGDSTGLNFSSGNPVPFTTGPTIMSENSATISDSYGNLLFYLGKPLQPINGSGCFTSLYNSSNSIIERGDTIVSDLSINAAMVFLPKPGDSSLYYLVYVNECIPAWCGYEKGIYYSVVDAHANSGAGKCIVQNKNLIDSIKITEHLAAVRHANGRDWWILTYIPESDSVITFLLDTSGIHGSFIQHIMIGVQAAFLTSGQMCFSQDGAKLGLVDQNVCDIFDFDRCTGQLSNPHYYSLDNLSMPSSIWMYGCAFSPNGNYFYIGAFLPNYSDSAYQLNVNSGQVTRLYGDANGDTLPKFSFGEYQLAPDGKIYIACSTVSVGYGISNYSLKNTHLTVIEYPDLAGLACQFSPYIFPLGGGRRSFSGLPNMPNYGLYQLPGSPCDTLGIGINELPQENFVMQIYPNPSSGEINILFSKFISSGEVKIMDITGREMRCKKLNHVNEIDFSIADLPAGIYFVQVKTQDGNGVKMFVRL